MATMRQITNFPIHAIDIENVKAFVSSSLTEAKAINELVNDKKSTEYLEKKLQITETEFFLHLLQQATCSPVREDKHSQFLRNG